MLKPKSSRKSFDFDFKVLKKVTRIPFTYSSKSQKVKIKKLAQKPKKLTLIYISCAVILLLVLFANTKAYRTWVIIEGLFGKTNLIGFQNSAELRPTGGFWGSFATLNLGGSLLSPTAKLDIETNVYRKDNLLVKANLDNAPKPVAETFLDRPQTFVNANWDPDFPEAAKTMSWYFAQGWGKPVDNVIAVSSITMIELLKMTGPIALSDGTAVNSDNFTAIMSQKIDQDYWTKEENKIENEPKKILLEIFPKLEAGLKKQPKVKLARKLLAFLDEKNIMIFSSDQKIQNNISGNNWAGEIPRDAGDFVYVVNANLNGGKSSLNVTEKIDLKISEESGILTNRLNVTRVHDSAPFPNIFNRNYTRVLIPLGSSVISVKDKGGILQKDQFEVIEEAGRKSVGFWLSTDLGREESVEISYLLPQSINKDNYELEIVRQPGTNFDEVTIDYLGKLKNFTLTSDKKISF